jgi:hypothetical protein
MPDVLHFRLKVPGESRIDSSGVYDSSVRIHGLARLEGNTLILEWSGTISHDEVGKTIGSWTESLPVKSASIPLSSLATVEFRRGWLLSPRLVLRASDLNGFSGIPGVEAGVLVLRLLRRDRRAGRDLAANLELGLADAALLEAENPRQHRLNR